MNSIIEKVLFSILWTIVYILKGRGPRGSPGPPPFLDEVIFKIESAQLAQNDGLVK